jgi:hypothetical protein
MLIISAISMIRNLIRTEIPETAIKIATMRISNFGSRLDGWFTIPPLSRIPPERGPRDIKAIDRPIG